MAKTGVRDTKFISPVKFQTSAPKHWHTKLAPRSVDTLCSFVLFGGLFVGGGFLSGEDVFL